MSLLWLYILVFLGALIWLGVDKNATGAFEFVRRNLHTTARDMGMYSEWVRYSLGRLVFLTILVILNVTLSAWTFATNPLDFGLAPRGTMLAAMLAGSLALVALPFLAARLRFLQFVYSKTAQLAELVAVANSGSEVQHHLDVAKYETRCGWTAWHPKQQDFERNPLWSEMVPVIFLLQGIRPSVVVPIDFTYFLAWNLPGEVQPGEPLPCWGNFLVETVHKIPWRSGWSVVCAEMDDLDRFMPFAAP
jgi:hypothetical protein